MFVHKTSLLASGFLNVHHERCAPTKIKSVYTLFWQGEIPSLQELRTDIEQHFSAGIVQWNPKQTCWFVLIPSAGFSWRDQCLMTLGMIPPGEGQRWFRIRITPAETFLTIATYDHHPLIEGATAGLTKLFAHTRNAAVIEN